MTAYPDLFSPLDLGGVTLRNRIAHASIVTRFVRDGQVTPELLNYHTSRARGGAAMIVTEPVAMISANRDPGRLRAYDDGALDSLKTLAAAVESEGCRLLGQIQDPGRGRHEVGRNDRAFGASALPDDLSYTVRHVMSDADIRQAIEEWAIAAGRLQRAGFSGVEVSAGHGHLFHQFLSPWSNRRDDQWGGDVEGRTRFVRELVKAVRSECGRPFIIGLKLPGDDGVPGGVDLDGAREIATAVAATGDVDFWTFAWGSHANSLWTHLPNAHAERAPYLNDIASIGAVAPDIACGALGYITDPNEGDHAVREGLADLVFLGRPLITDAAFPNKAREGREAEIRYCVSCNTCWRSIIDGKRLECDNNPRVAEPDEDNWQPRRAASRKKVVIAGGGIAGLEAAWVAAARGHEVTLFSAADEVGGKTRLHAELPGGENLSSIYDYQYLTAKRHGVKFELGVEATAADIAALGPDQVLLATGSTMRAPAFIPAEYIEEDFIVDLRAMALQFVGRNSQEDGRLVIVDRDHTEMTYAAAEMFAGIFSRVAIVTPRERIASDCSLVNRQEIYQRLHDRHVEIVT
ncbi:MAG: FAD-dependent oxidoreductase, partial [Gammaproteobacteria bacterium]|nr:FAD-dependent oxidoreductase [Gammaproteobacteria bacterium]